MVPVARVVVSPPPQEVTIDSKHTSVPTFAAARLKRLPSAVLRALSCWEDRAGSDHQRPAPLELNGSALGDGPRTRRPEARLDVAGEALGRQQTRPAQAHRHPHVTRRKRCWRHHCTGRLAPQNARTA